MKNLSVLLALTFLSFPIATAHANSTLIDCKKAAEQLKPWAEGKIDEIGKKYRSRLPVKDVPLIEKDSLPRPWDWRWVSNPVKRAWALAKHRIIWKATQEALRGVNTAKNLKLIESFGLDEDVDDLAVRALGEIGDVSSADFLISLVRRIHQNGRPGGAFWAPTALGELKYQSRTSKEYLKAEHALFQLLLIPGYETNFEGLVLMRSSRAFQFFKANLSDSTRDWMAGRALLTWHNRSGFEAIRQYMLKDGDRGFFHGLRLVRNYSPALLDSWAIDSKALFAEIANRYFELYYEQSSNTLTSHPSLLAEVLSMMPPECHW